MQRCVVLAAVLAGCGDNVVAPGPELTQADRLVVVAHPDDDLIFLSPELSDAIKRGEAITIVYVTAGQATHGEDYVKDRESGLRAAYTSVTGDPDWDCGWIWIREHAARHCRQHDRGLSLVFLRFRDGGVTGEWDGSLLHLWQGDVARVATVAWVESSYDRDELIEVIADLMTVALPHTVDTLDFTAAYGYDHSDHMITAAIVTLAAARARLSLPIVGHRGYNTMWEAENVPAENATRADHILGYYAACAEDCGRCGDVCTSFNDAYRTWIRRHYAVARRVPPLAGRLALETERCAATRGNGELALAPCDQAPVWQFAVDGTVRTPDDRCMTVPAGAARAVVVAACDGDSDQVFLLEDQGGLWSARPPEPAPDMAYRHLLCLGGGDDGAITARLCGDGAMPRWQLNP